MPRRSHQILLVVSILWVSWLLMMLLHESGHVLGAVLTGGDVQRVVWHPAAISRTDVQPNPHPLFVVWAGPLIGSLVPLVVAAVASMIRAGFAYLLWVWAGFCLIANGMYIGLGVIHPVADAAELLTLGTPRWLLAVFGLVTVLGGFWIWDRVSPKLGFGSKTQPVRETHAWVTFALAVVVTAMGIALGDRGL